jgi:hypothetical protein
MDLKEIEWEMWTGFISIGVAKRHGGPVVEHGIDPSASKELF